MNKDYKPVYVRGTETGKGVIEALETLGGINKYIRDGKKEYFIYFIDPKSHIIDCVFKNSSVGEYIIATAEEVKPLR